MATKRTTTKKSTKKATKKTKSRASGTGPAASSSKRGAKPQGNASARIDAYIADAPRYAQPILTKLRALFHKACPDLVETIKWGVPHFDYKGPMGGIAAFKNHVSFGFWKSELMQDTHNLFDRGPKASMCTVKITDVKSMPPDKVLVSYMKQAKELNDAGAKISRAAKSPKPPLEVPADLLALLAKNKKAKETFDAFSPSHRREYIEWIVEAKRDETRQNRLASTIQQLNEGKSRHWKYQPK